MNGAEPQQKPGEEDTLPLNGAGESIAMCFSGGKDSSLALWEIRRAQTYVVETLLTTVNAEYDRVSMHGVRRELLREQADAIGIPMTEVPVPRVCTNAVYEREMGAAFARLAAAGIRRVAFGDIFLEDLRTYREEQLAASKLECFFPLWKQDTGKLARRFIQGGFKAVLVCVNLKVLDSTFAGRRFDEALLSDLPPGVDPCGENGEFHTFVYDGPVFRRSVRVSTGEVVQRDSFVFCDLLAASPPRRSAPPSPNPGGEE
ncbi:MAG: diphthine--ammonia ligase [Acidobacteriota bacterium]|nr:diphthine--ammonia ligase [Acidobacteriota bacterium]